MRRYFSSLFFLLALTLVCVSHTYASPITLLHEFNNTNGDQLPFGGVIKSGNVLYGTTRYGGASGQGTVYAVNIDGSGYTVLHEFAGGGSDGMQPYGNLVISGSTLYGMSTTGGDSNVGVIYSISTNGSGFTLIREFAAGGNDGANPEGSLILSGSTLYGMTTYGGDTGVGTIFSIATNGSGFTLLHEFAGGGSDGQFPYGDLTISGSTLYGMTYGGGDADLGTIFSIATNGSGFTLLHEFAGGGSDGKRPLHSNLIISGSTLYGTTYNGGDADLGTIFSIATNGSGFTLLHEYEGNSDGSLPDGGLILSGSTLYGMTNSGGNNSRGVIYSIDTNGANFYSLHLFAGGVSDGQYPQSNLILSGSTFYGTTSRGGDNNVGTVFSFPLDVTAPTISITALSPDPTWDRTPTFTGTATDSENIIGAVKYQIDGTSGSWTDCNATNSPFDSDSEAYTCAITTVADGTHTIYVRATDNYANTTAELNYAQDTFTVDTTPPSISLDVLIPDPTTDQTPTFTGSTTDIGAVQEVAFAMDVVDPDPLSLLHEFTEDSDDGGEPYGSLIKSGNVLYGMTAYGGDDGAGTIFKINADGTGFTLLHEFADGSDDGSNPMGSLTLVGSTLYGMTPYGGDDGAGTIFSIATNGTGFTLLHEFTGGENDGKRPYGSLLNLDSMLYGMTRLGGDNDAGTIFNIRTDGTGYKISHEFTDAVDDGGRPQGNLTLSGSTFYGMTNSGGNDAYGTIFSIGLPTVFTPCTADDGAFDETSEDFTCQIADSLSSGDHIIYVQATDSLGNISDSTTDTFTISISTSTSAPAQSQSTSTHSDSPSGPSLPQIAKNSGGVYSPSGDSSTDGQKVIAIISPNTMSFDAYLSSQAVNINSLPFAPEPLMSRLLSFITFKKKPQPLKTNAAIIGSIVKVKIGTSVYYQIGKIQNIWYKDYYNNSKILPTAQNKPTIIAISYTLEDIIIPGRKPTKNGVYQKYNSKNLKIIYSPDGAMWRILNTSVVDAKNQTVAVLDKPAGYYMIVGR